MGIDPRATRVQQTELARFIKSALDFAINALSCWFIGGFWIELRRVPACMIPRGIQDRQWRIQGRASKRMGSPPSRQQIKAIVDLHNSRDQRKSRDPATRYVITVRNKSSRKMPVDVADKVNLLSRGWRAHQEANPRWPNDALFRIGRLRRAD